MTRNFRQRSVYAARLILFVAATTWACPALAQDTTRIPSGVELVGRYNVSKRPLIAIRAAPGPAPAAVRQVVKDVIERDLVNSNRFEIGAVPQQLAAGPIDYRAWNSLQIWYVAAPSLVQRAAGYQLRVDIHDVVYGTLKASVVYDLPAATSPQFRMAVHAVSDEIVRQITGQPGIAATRVIFARRTTGGYELLAVDSDGENVSRLVGPGGMIYSPTWSPDGSRIAYAIRSSNNKVELRELDLRANKTRTVSSAPQLSYAPAYSPDGKKLAFTATNTSLAQEITEYDLERNCCLRRLSRGARDDLSPSYSPDGQRIAFNSNRIGQPHVYTIPVNGGEATLISPYTPGESGYYTAPDWSPTGDEIVFVGRSRGLQQIMIADANRPGTAKQITSTGDNEDPSWAPDGRHVVFARVGGSEAGLFVMDTQTGTMRKLISGMIQMPDWSLALLRVHEAR